MKKMLVLLATAVALAATAAAQTPIRRPPTDTDQGHTAQLTPEQRADRQVRNLTTRLALSTDQTTKVRAIALAQAQALQALREKYAAAGNRQGMGQELKINQQQYDAQLKDVLTPDQYATYTQLRQERITEARQRRSN